MNRVVSSSCIAALLSIGAVAFAQTTGQNPTGASGQAGTPTMTSPTQTGDRAQTQQQVTLVGCIQRESDYRQAAGGGRGGALGTGVGVGNEFVLVNASTAPASSQSSTSTTPSATAGATATTPTTGTAGTATGTATAGVSATPPATSPASSPASATMAGSGKAYALSGNREKELEPFVGQRVEIVGTVEGGARSGATTSGTPTTGTTPGTTAGATAGTAAGTPTGTTATGTATMSGSTGSQRFGDLQQVNIVSFRAVSGSCSQ